MSKYIIICITALLFSCGHTKQLAATATSVTVLSYNIHHGNPPSQAKGVIDLDTIAATIRASNASLVAIQELDSGTNRSGRVYQLQVLAQQLGMHYHFERTIPYEGGAYGIGILSKYPLQEVKGYALPGIDGVPTEPRRLLVAKVMINGLPLYFACTHIDFKNAAVKQLQATEVVKVLGALKGERVIIAGDFNAVPAEESIQLLKQQYASAGSDQAFTIPVIAPTKKIDFIFYTPKGLALQQDRVMTAHNYGSDHLPVVGVFGVGR